MSRKRIHEMLQDCLDGYEAGLTPEECLSPYAEHRHVLEPLLREALALRVAYAQAPSEELREHAREKLMFAAGRDVRHALTAEPDAGFVAQERARFLNLAGASAQEALRDVPPPRLAFWSNARRRLLDAASTSTTSPRRRLPVAMRYAASAAVVAIAIGVAVLAPFGGNSPQSADARLAAIAEQIDRIERQTQSGQSFSAVASDIRDATVELNQIADTLDDKPELAQKVGNLLERVSVQQEAIKQTAQDEPAVVQAEEQINQTQEKLEQFAALVASPTEAAAVAPTEPFDTPTPVQTEEPQTIPTPEPLGEDGYRRAVIQGDDTAGLVWEQIDTRNVSFVVPTNWQIIGLGEDEDGVATVSSSFIGIYTDGEEAIVMALSLTNGSVTALILDEQFTLREAGPDGEIIAPDFLLSVPGDAGVPLYHFVTSITVGEEDESP